MSPEHLADQIEARSTLEEGWIDYVATGQFADVIASRDADVVLATIREARVAWYAGLSHGIATLVTAGIDPALLSAMADQLFAFVQEEKSRVQEEKRRHDRR